MNNFPVGALPLTPSPLLFTQTLLQELEEGVATLDANNQVTFCNPAFGSLVHRSPEGIAGQSILHLFPDWQSPETLSKEGVEQEVASGYNGTLRVRLFPLVEENGVRQHTLVILNKSQVAEKHNKEGVAPLYQPVIDPQLLEKITDEMPCVVTAYHVHTGQYFYVNKAVESLLGYSPETVLNGGISFVMALIHPDDKEELLARNAEALQRVQALDTAKITHEPVSFDYRLKHRNGEWKWLHTVGVAFSRDANGAVSQVMNVSLDVTDTKKAEEHIRSKEALLRGAQSVAGFGLWEFNPADGSIDWSDEMFRIFGYQPGEVNVNLALYEKVVHPHDWERFKQEVDKVLRDQQPYTSERRIFRPDGSLRYIVSRIDVTKDSAGKLLKVVGLTVDISELKQIQNELDEKQRFIQRIAETTPDILYIYDIKEQRNVYANRRLPQLLGFSVEQVQQMNDRFLALFTHSEDFPRLLRTMEKLAASADNEVVEVEYRTMDSQGNWHWFSDRATVFSRDPDGSVREILGSSQDITDRKLAQDRLTENEYFIKQIADAVPDGIYVYDLQKRQSIYNNRQIYQQLGYSPEEFSAMGNKTTQIITHPEDLSRRLAHYQALHQLPDGEVAEIEYRVKTKQGEWRWVRTRDSVFRRDVSGTPLQSLGIVQDITERKKEAEALKFKDHLVQAMLSHFPLMLTCINQEGTIVEASGSGLRNLRLEENQLVGESIFTLYPTAAPYIREVINGNKSTFLLDIEVDGEKRYWQNYYFFDHDRKCAVGFAIDITEQKEIEERLSESQQFIEQVSNAVPQIIYVYDLLEARNIYINREVYSALGYTQEEIASMGNRVMDQLVHPEDKQTLQEHYEKLADEPSKVLDLEYRLKDAHGNWRWYFGRITLFKRTPAGQAWQILGAAQDITERKLIENRIAESEAILRETQQIAQVGSYSWDMQQNELTWTDEHYHIFGLEPGEWVDLDKVTALFHPEDRQRVIEAIQYAINSGEPFNCNFRIVRPNGEERYVWSRAKLFYSASAQPVRFAGSVLDVTELKKTEAELLESQHFIQQIADATLDVLYVYDLPQQKVVYVNREITEMLGYPPEEVYQMSHEETLPMVHPDDRAKREAHFQRVAAAKDNEICMLEYRVKDAQGNWRWLYMRNAVFKRASDGTVVQMIGLSQDITSRKKAELELAESQQFIQRIADASPDHLYVFDLTQNELVYINREIYETLGYQPDELYKQGRHILDFLMHPEDIPRVKAHLAAFKDVKDNELREVEYRLKDKKDNWRWILARETVFKRDEKGFPLQITGVSRDVTARKQSEAELHFKNKIINGILTNLPVFLSIIDRNGVLREAAGAGLRRVGTEDGAIVGENVLRDPKYDSVAEHIKSVLSGNQVTFIGRPVQQDHAYYYLNYYYYDAEIESAIGFSLDITQEKENEQKLKESEEQLRKLNAELEQRVRERAAELTASEERYRIFVQQSAEAIWRFELSDIPYIPTDSPEEEQINLIYAHAYVAECNDAMAQMYGFATAQEIIGTRLGDLMPQSDPVNIEYLRNFMRSGYRLSNAESVELDRNGNLKYFLNNLLGILEEGKLIRAWGTQRDITDRKRAEEALREKEQEYRSLVTATSQMVWYTNTDGLIEEDIPLWRRYTGQSRAEVQGRGWLEAVHPDDKDRVASAWKRAVENHQLYETEYRVRSKHGEYRWFFARGVPIFGRNGNVKKWIGACNDIHERRMMEEALRRSEKRFRIALANSPVTVFECDENLRYTWIHNPRFGVSQEQILGKRDDELVPPPIAEKMLAYKQQALALGKSGKFELEVQHDGLKYYYDVITEPLKAANGTVTGLTVASIDISMQRRVEEALRESEERLSLAARAAGVGIFDWDIHSGNVVWTEQEERLFGLRPGTFEGNLDAWASYVLPEDLAVVQTRIQQHLVSRQTEISFDFRIKRADGEIRWIEGTAKFVYAPDGTPLRMVGTNVDTTERRLAEQALRESESRFRGLFESDMIGIQFGDQKGTITDANNAFLRLLGYSREDLQTGTVKWKDITPPEYEAVDELAIQELLTKNLVTPYEKEYLRKDGLRVDVLVGATRLKTAKESIAVGFVLDISERKKAQQQLKQSEERFRLVAKATNEGIWDWAIETDTVWQNEGYYKLFGYVPSKEHADLAEWTDRLHLDEKERVKESLSAALQSNETFWSDEYRIRKADGSYAYIMDRAYILRDEQGKPVRMIGSKIDLTQLKEAQAALERQTIDLKQSNADLEQFAYISSHDLQEPLNTAASFAKLLKRRYENQLDTDANDFIHFIVDATDRMKNIIRSLLEYSRVSSANKEMNNVDIAQVLEEVQQNLQQPIADTGAIVQIGPMPSVRATETQMVQLFQNLFSNAIKFRSKTAPCITVEAEEQPAYWLFKVSDNGIGMEMRHAKEKIFQVFQRLHSREEYEGTGIGLAIGKKIVERHGGTIWADSELGKGSVFYFTIKK